MGDGGREEHLRVDPRPRRGNAERQGRDPHEMERLHDRHRVLLRRHVDRPGHRARRRKRHGRRGAAGGRQGGQALQPEVLGGHPGHLRPFHRAGRRAQLAVPARAGERLLHVEDPRGRQDRLRHVLRDRSLQPRVPRRRFRLRHLRQRRLGDQPLHQEHLRALLEEVRGLHPGSLRSRRRLGPVRQRHRAAAAHLEGLHARQAGPRQRSGDLLRQEGHVLRHPERDAGAGGHAPRPVRIGRHRQCHRTGPVARGHAGPGHDGRRALRGDQAQDPGHGPRHGGHGLRVRPGRQLLRAQETHPRRAGHLLQGADQHRGARHPHHQGRFPRPLQLPSAEAAEGTDQAPVLRPGRGRRDRLRARPGAGGRQDLPPGRGQRRE